jgi:hypothetical protein
MDGDGRPNYPNIVADLARRQMALTKGSVPFYTYLLSTTDILEQ